MSGGILKHFTLTCKFSLPNPDGPISKVVPSEGILLEVALACLLFN